MQIKKAFPKIGTLLIRYKTRNGKLSLGELWSATSCFETVFLTLFHSWVTSQQTSFFQFWTHFVAVLQQSASDTVTDSTSLTGNAATANGANNVKLPAVLVTSNG